MPSAMWSYEGKVRLIDEKVVIGEAKELDLTNILAQGFVDELGMGLVRITIERIERVGP